MTQDNHDEFVRNYVNEEIVADLMSETMSSSELARVFAGKLGKDDSNVIVSFLKWIKNGIKNVFHSKDEFPNKFSDIIGMFEGAVKNGVDNASDAGYNNTRYKLVKTDGVDVFPPYNESGSDTNERATRWAHKREIEDYTQRIFYHENIRYLVEKDSSLSLNYRVIRRITNKEYNRNKAFYSTIGGDIDGNYTERQQGRTGVVQSSKIDSVGTESSKRSNGHSIGINRYNGKTSSTQRLGGEQNAERRIDVERGRASERSVEDTQGNVKRKFALSNSITPEQDAEYLELAKNPEQNDTTTRKSLTDTGVYSLEDAWAEKVKKYEYSSSVKKHLFQPPVIPYHNHRNPHLKNISQPQFTIDFLQIYAIIYIE